MFSHKPALKRGRNHHPQQSRAKAHGGLTNLSPATDPLYSIVLFFCPNTLTKSMKSLREIEEELAKKAEQVLGFKPSSKFKRGSIGILIYVVCGIIVFISLRSAGVF